MKLEVDIKRADQSLDFSTGVYANFLVLDVFGVEVRVPVTEEQLGAVLQALHAAAAAVPEESAMEPRQPPAVFLGETPEAEDPVPPRPAQHVQPEAPRRLSPVQRPRGDDAGIAQG